MTKAEANDMFASYFASICKLKHSSRLWWFIHKCIGDILYLFNIHRYWITVLVVFAVVGAVGVHRVQRRRPVHCIQHPNLPLSSVCILLLGAVALEEVWGILDGSCEKCGHHDLLRYQSHHYISHGHHIRIHLSVLSFGIYYLTLIISPFPSNIYMCYSICQSIGPLFFNESILFSFIKYINDKVVSAYIGTYSVGYLGVIQTVSPLHCSLTNFHLFCPW